MDIDVTKLSTTSKYVVDKLYVTVYLTNQLEQPPFKGFAKSISSVDEKGPFDVLPSHENFVTNFSKKLEIVRETGEKVNYSEAKGTLEVANNVVRIYLEKANDAK